MASRGRLVKADSSLYEGFRWYWFIFRYNVLRSTPRRAETLLCCQSLSSSTLVKYSFSSRFIVASKGSLVSRSSTETDSSVLLSSIKEVSDIRYQIEINDAA